MVSRLLVSALLLGLCRAPLASAQTEIDPRVTQIAPFIDVNTVLLVHLDLRKLQLKTAVDTYLKLAPAEAKPLLGQVPIVVMGLEAARTKLVDAGAKDVYVVATDDGTGADKVPFVVLPVETGKEPAEVVAALKELPGVDQEPFVHNGAVILGDPSAQEQVEGIKAGRAAEFSYCFKMAGATDLQLVFLPTQALIDKVAKKAAEQGQDAAGETAKAVAAEARAVIITANFPPKSALAFMVKLKDEAAAAAALAQIKQGMASEKAQEVLSNPIFAKLVPIFTPKQEKELLKITLTDANGGIQTLADSVKDGLALAVQLFAGGGIPGGAGGPGRLPTPIPPPQ